MFEKEATEYATVGWDKSSDPRDVFTPRIDETKFNDWRNGAEFGYNKANEWHYPSKGELPKEDTAEKETFYLLCFGLDNSDYTSGVFTRGRFWCFDSGWYETNEVIAWKEIVLPELPKESE